MCPNKKGDLSRLYNVHKFQADIWGCGPVVRLLANPAGAWRSFPYWREKFTATF